MGRNENKGVLFLNSCLYPCFTGGIELFHHFFIKALSSAMPCMVLSRCAEGFDGYDIEVKQIGSPLGRLQTLFTVWDHIVQIINMRHRIGVIHIPYSSKSLFQFYHVMLLAKLLGIPYILRIHGGGMHPGRPDFLHAMYFRNAAGVIAVSSPVKDEYEKRYGRPIVHMPSYLPFLDSPHDRIELRRRYAIEENAVMFLYLGSVKEIKGPDVLLDAVTALGAEWMYQNSVRVVFAGGGDLLDPLCGSLEERGLAGLVRFEGNVQYENVHHYYRMADVFVIPSLMEARPLALAEALYNGLPAIGTDIPTIANTIRHGENGLVFSKSDPSSLAEAVRRMVEDPEFRQSCARASAERRDGFDHFNDMVDDYIEFYEDIMQRTG